MKFLDWFIDEQLEEEVNATDMVTKMKLFGSDAKSLYELDQEYLARTARLLRLLRNRRAQTSRVSGGPALCRSVFMMVIPSTHVMAFMFAKTCGACRHAAFAPPRSNRQRLPGKTRIVVLQEWTCPTKQNGSARAPTRFLMVGHKGFEPLTY